MEKIIIQNGGKYSAELTKNCTHLISDISFFLWFFGEDTIFSVVVVVVVFFFFFQNTEKFDLRCKHICVYIFI